jgi:hypothetical protein
MESGTYLKIARLHNRNTRKPMAVIAARKTSRIKSDFLASRYSLFIAALQSSRFL